MVACCLEIEGAGRGTVQVLGSRPNTLSPRKRGISVCQRTIDNVRSLYDG